MMRVRRRQSSHQIIDDDRARKMTNFRPAQCIENERQKDKFVKTYYLTCQAVLSWVVVSSIIVLIRHKLIVHTLSYVKCNYIWHMDFYFCLPLYGQLPIKTGLFTYNYTTCSFLQSLLTIWMHISCSFDMSY